MTGKTLFLSAVLILFIINGSAYAYYEVIDLGPGIAYSINDNGQIAGESGGHAVIFDTTGQGNNIDLGTPGGYTDSRALSINNNGQVVGVDENPQVLYSHACLFDSTGGGANIDLGTLGGDMFNAATSINNGGQIVGYADNSDIFGNYYGTYACLFDATGGGVNLDLGTFGNMPPYSIDGSMAYSINDNGRIVGAALYYISPSIQHYHAAYFDETGGGANLELGTLGGSESWARFINNDNQIVGYASTPEANPDPLYPEYLHAVLFDSSGGGANIDLGTLGGEESRAMAINDFGQIIGYSEIPGYMYPHACLFDPTGQGNNIDLNTLIDPSSGWKLLYAHSINNNGWIVGVGTYHGDGRAFLLTPEPATVLLLGLGGLMILRRRRI